MLRIEVPPVNHGCEKHTNKMKHGVKKKLARVTRYLVHWGKHKTRQNKIVCYGLLRCLLRFITAITDFYYGNFGAFTKEFVNSEKAQPNWAQNPTFGQNRDLFLLPILQI